MNNVTLHTILGNQRQADGSLRKIAFTGDIYLNTHGLEAKNGIQEYFQDPDCALMHYAGEHYDYWRERYPALPGRHLYTGLFGENFSTYGMTESNVCIGDVFSLGEAVIQISWGRAACRTMAERLQDPHAPELMHQQSRNGWFYRVLRPGKVRCGDVFILLERPAAEWPLSRVQSIVFGDVGTQDELMVLAKMTFLAEGWRKQAEIRLENRYR